jgi:hypothetical protein
MTTRTDQFKEELFALLRKYKVEMSVREETHAHQTWADGVDFFAFAEYDKEGEMTAAAIDLHLGTWENGDDA